MRRRRIWIGLALLLVLGVAGYPLLSAWGYAVDDPLDREGYDTGRKLAEYARNGDSGPVRRWLREYRGEGQGMQTMITTVEWSLESPREFIALIESMDPKERKQFIQRFRFSVGDSGATECFEETFRGHR